MFSAIWPALFFLVLTALMTFPLITNMGGSIIHGFTADADVSRWDLWWVKTSLLERHSNPFYTDMLYYPYRQGLNPLNLYYHTLQPFNAILALPFLLLASPAVGPTLGYNALVLFHFVLSGLAMFWLVRYLTGNQVAGLVAGVLFTFSPFHQYHLQYGQLELMPLQWLPLFLLFLHKLLYLPLARRKYLLYGALALGALVAASYTSWYLTLYTLMLGGILVFIRLLENPRRWFRTLFPFFAVLAGWALLVGPFLLVTMRAAHDPSFELVSGLDYEVRFSLSPLTLITGSKDTRFIPAVWNLGSLSLSAILLGAVGAWRLGKRGVFWLVLIVTGTVLALGPYLRMNEAMDVAHSTGIPLPYLWLRNLPFLSISRVPRRFIVLAYIGLDVLAGYATVYLLDAARRLAPRLRSVSPSAVTAVVVALLFLLPLAELITVPQPAATVSISPFFSHVANKPGKAILELPVTTHYLRDHVRMLNQTVHTKKIIGGYTARRVVDYYLDANSPFYTFILLDPKPKKDIVPPLEPAAILNYYDIPYVVFYKQDESYERPGDKPAVEKFVKAFFPSSTIAQDDADITAYKEPPTSPTEPLVWVGDGWYPPESQGAKTWRWSQGHSTLRINNKAAMPLHLQFAANTFRGPANLTVSLDDKPLKVANIIPSASAISVDPVQLPPGEHAVKFSSDAAPVSPSEIRGSSPDKRQLAFVIENLRIR